MKLYKHRNNTDVAIEVLKRFYIKEKDSWNLLVHWWNIGKCHKPWPMQITQRITIPADQWQTQWEAIPFP